MELSRGGFFHHHHFSKTPNVLPPGSLYRGFKIRGAVVHLPDLPAPHLDARSFNILTDSEIFVCLFASRGRVETPVLRSGRFGIG